MIPLTSADGGWGVPPDQAEASLCLGGVCMYFEKSSILDLENGKT